MEETREIVYGRYLGKVILKAVESIPENQRFNYKSRLIQELRKYPLGEDSRTSGLRIFHLDIEKNPEQLARIVGEGISLMHDAERAKAVLDSLLQNL